MARKRMIDPNIWQSEDFSKLSTLAKLVFIGMFSNADDEGRGRANPVYLKSILFPYDDGMRVIDIEKSLSEISAYLSVTLYDHDGNKYYQLENWGKWQRVEKAQPSQFPAPKDNSATNRRLIDDQSSNVRGTVPPNRIEENRKEEKEKESVKEKDAAASTLSAQKKYGEYGWVKLSDEQYIRLISENGESVVSAAIQYIDESAQRTSNKNHWRDWNLVIRKAIREDWGGVKKKVSSAANKSYDIDDIERKIMQQYRDSG